MTRSAPSASRAASDSPSSRSAPWCTCTRRSGVNRAASRCQLPTSDIGHTSSVGCPPGWPATSDSSWMVLPRPMSSARMPPRPSSPRKDSQDSPRCWYGRSSPEKPAGVGIGRSRWSTWPDSRSPSQPSASTPTSGTSSSGPPAPCPRVPGPSRPSARPRRSSSRPGCVRGTSAPPSGARRPARPTGRAAGPAGPSAGPARPARRDRAPGRLLPRRTGSPPGHPGRTWLPPPRRATCRTRSGSAWSASARAWPCAPSPASARRIRRRPAAARSP